MISNAFSAARRNVPRTGKNLLLITLALLFSVSLCACGAGGSSESPPYIFLSETLGEETYAIGFRPEDKELEETVSGAVKALVLNRTYERIGDRYPDIKDYLCLDPGDVVEASLPAEGSGDPDFTFRQGIDLAYPPYTYLSEDGIPSGFDVELCRAVCDYMGWKYEAVPFRWEERNDVLFSGKCDCIWSGFTKEGREESYLWSIAYSYNTQGILVAADSGITELSDLRGKTVGVQSGTSSADILAGEKAELASGFGELKMYETSLQAFDDLKAGVIDAAAMDMTAGAYMVAGETEGGK